MFPCVFVIQDCNALALAQGSGTVRLTFFASLSFGTEGPAFSKIWERLVGKTEMRILMVGLNAAGKTTILYQLKRVRQSPVSAEYVLSSEGTSASPPELCVTVRLHPWRVPRKMFGVIVIYMVTRHLATCMSLSSTSSGLPGKPATESHTSISTIMSYNECYNVCSGN